ncbi:MAG: sensor histidine kinase [Thermoleophilaceae bacterium]
MAAERILVVDDEESVAVTIQAILEMDGHEVVTAASGKAALEALRDGSFDLVLTDLRLQDLDGLRVIEAVRERSPDTITIVLTGYASLDSAVRALREGAYGYLLKPCDVEELRHTIARGLERRALGQQLRQRVAELEQANATISGLNADLERRVEAATAELRQNVERLKELDELKSQFISIASHELKTPVTAMSGFLQVAVRRLQRFLAAAKAEANGSPDEVRQVVAQLEIVSRQTGRLARLIDELLDVSRLQSGRLALEKTEVDLAALSREVAERLQHTAPRHVLRVHSAAPSSVVVDRDRIEQVLDNLVVNAIKYSPKGGPVDIEVGGEGDQARISVRDRGIGIPRDELDSIFGPFYRSQDRRAREVGGMGLGLHISKEIVERHGGRIWAESEPRQGATFHVALPRKDGPRAA